MCYYIYIYIHTYIVIGKPPLTKPPFVNSRITITIIMIIIQIIRIITDNSTHNNTKHINITTNDNTIITKNNTTTTTTSLRHTMYILVINKNNTATTTTSLRPRNSNNYYSRSYCSINCPHSK